MNVVEAALHHDSHITLLYQRFRAEWQAMEKEGDHTVLQSRTCTSKSNRFVILVLQR
ncbi:hypothetical protein MD535_03300 [Vibrio sp. ZSDZ65]|uniref:Uncharacterized protein n=1 Tax=Vibrio qingdaonensis TaxID=2829491 RepID=A0A9X3HVB6_9VIBR|nr:hypothetical protein [Vibrio qingdaonensis]MCW8345053.1 hypothetical protein [Vibrio qingdaonensis]